MKGIRLLVPGLCMLVTLACLGQTAGVFASRDSGNFSQAFYSIGAQDGWVVGTGAYDDVGAEIDNSSSLRVGDENGYGAHQIRSLVSFDTSRLPDDAIITRVELVLRQESIVIGGGNPFTDFRGLLIDVKMGPFGAAQLEPEDFQALADVSSFGPYQRELTDTYLFQLGRAAYPLINKWPVFGGLTQFRLRFVLDSDRNDRPNYIHFYSGDEQTRQWRPKLLVEYHLPSRTQMGSIVP